jgi:putative protein kinase ArgK-like GTPase of G3E family
VPELLEALDRRRDDAPGDHDAARMSRAKAMVEAIVAQRIQAGLASDALRERGEGMVRAVAAHELDPYVAADELLVAFRTDPARR